ncbi:hypothetical protein AYI70_g8794 [Smittium culicis]|uniref:Uncharacterized protein n=1 Tax=Smittium culicis TaxID=133412 RepID=A0A1R1XED1_9FUNG|nr:hypothetical protein AYI70_g8794 [Smittium culicis]
MYRYVSNQYIVDLVLFTCATVIEHDWDFSAVPVDGLKETYLKEFAATDISLVVPSKNQQLDSKGPFDDNVQPAICDGFEFRRDQPPANPAQQQVRALDDVVARRHFDTRKRVSTHHQPASAHVFDQEQVLVQRACRAPRRSRRLAQNFRAMPQPDQQLS